MAAGRTADWIFGRIGLSEGADAGIRLTEFKNDG